MASSSNAPGREETGALPPLPEITVDIPRTPMRANTDDTLTMADDVSPATLAPERCALGTFLQELD
jgi:P-type Ca2+ transporter type 2C